MSDYKKDLQRATKAVKSETTEAPWTYEGVAKAVLGALGITPDEPQADTQAQVRSLKCPRCEGPPLGPPGSPHDCYVCGGWGFVDDGQLEVLARRLAPDPDHAARQEERMREWLDPGRPNDVTYKELYDSVIRENAHLREALLNLAAGDERLAKIVLGEKYLDRFEQRVKEHNEQADRVDWRMHGWADRYGPYASDEQADQPRTVHTFVSHVYVSTACQHGQHGRCRGSCKFCETPCLCPCHREPVEVEEAISRRESEDYEQIYSDGMMP